MRLFATSLAATFLLAGVHSADTSNSVGCSTHSHRSSDLPSVAEIEGRRTSLWYPPKYDGTAPVPVIVAFHDSDQSVKTFSRSTQLTNHTLNDFAIVVYPHRPQHGWSSELQNGNETQSSRQQDDGNPADDISWTGAVLDNLERSFCIDLARIYITGLGSGGGLSNLLACQSDINQRVAAFAAVNAALYRPIDFVETSVWSTCNTGEAKVPVMEIHSSANDRHRYYPKKGDVGLRLPDWLSMWSKQNECGGIDGPTLPSSWSDATYVTKLKNGQMSEGNVNGGGVTRVSYRCRSRKQSDEGMAEQVSDVESSEEDPSHPSWYRQTSTVWHPEDDENDEDATILHYNLQGLAHGWPRQEIRHSGVVVMDGVEVKPPGKPYFDTTAVMLHWMKSHRLSNPHPVELGGASLPVQLHEDGRDEL